MNTTNDTAERMSRLISEGMEAHRSGRPDEAERLYRRVLDEVPSHPDALHLTGLLRAQRGRYDEAAELIGRAIESAPREAMFHNNLGNVERERGHLDAAEAGYRRAVELDPGRLDAFNNLGVLFSRTGRPELAERLLLQLVEVAPSFADARQNLAAHYMRNGDLNEAVQVCMNGLIVDTRSQELRRLLGAAYGYLGRAKEAAEVYRAWLAVDPDNPVAQHHLKACTGEQPPERAADEYVRRTFDGFAASFDAKLASLDYKAPELVGAAVARLLGLAEASRDVLDAGCGTGLCGPLLRPYARRLEGVDLSQGMLDRAVLRGFYDELRCAELVGDLQRHPGRWDLLVSADTLCYFGRLEAFAEAAAASLRPGGLVVFTVEALDEAAPEPEFKLQMHGRYSHRRGYVVGALAGGGLDAFELEPVVLREEGRKPVHGWLVCARAAGARRSPGA